MSKHADAIESIGTILTGEVQRDAVHFAVYPAMAAKVLWPGEAVGLVDKDTASDKMPPLGIVDPFLKEPVEAGQKFWIILFPRTITSLHHVWEHPELDKILKPASNRVAESEAWLRNFIGRSDCPDYETVIAAASGQKVPEIPEYGEAYENDGESLYFRGRDAHALIPPEFWDHVEVVTGKKITKRPGYFSCSC